MTTSSIVALVACGGSTPEPTTFHATLTPFEERESFRAVQAALDAKDIKPLTILCGFFDQAKLPPEQRLSFIEGRTPRVVYFVIPANQVERARSVEFPGFNELTEAWSSANSDPVECGVNAAEAIAVCCR